MSNSSRISHLPLRLHPNWDYLELRRATTLEGLRTAEIKRIWNKHTTGAMGLIAPISRPRLLLATSAHLL